MFYVGNQAYKLAGCKAFKLDSLQAKDSSTVTVMKPVSFFVYV